MASSKSHSPEQWSGLTHVFNNCKCALGRHDMDSHTATAAACLQKGVDVGPSQVLSAVRAPFPHPGDKYYEGRMRRWIWNGFVKPPELITRVRRWKDWEGGGEIPSKNKILKQLISKGFIVEFIQKNNFIQANNTRISKTQKGWAGIFDE